MNYGMSAIGPKQTSLVHRTCPFGGKADISFEWNQIVANASTSALAPKGPDIPALMR
jgi:hypothetical protein